MDTSSLERFALAARHALEDGVAQRLYTLALDDDGRREFPAGSDVVRGRVLSNRERRWRDDLVRAVGEEGLAAFSARMAYTWFNRLLAIRYMEVHGFLPCRMRMFSNAGGAFEPEVLARPFEVEIEGLDPEEVSALVASGDDEALFRCFLLAQVGELAATMPQVFGEVGAAESLTLPDNLLSQSDANAVYLAVRDLQESPVDGEGEPLESVWWPKDEDGDADPTEILGWLYQFYNAEARAEYNSSKRKASKEDLPVATQVFTPRWIVRYLVENSLGRLWVQGRPGSPLLGAMPYYIAPEEEPADVAVASPEDITLLDPAMGSGHMLGYAFELLCAIYREAGYRDRDVPALILEKNLSGFEVDARAAQIAAFRLLMLAREHDRRLMSRGVEPRITVFSDVVFPEGSLQMTALEDDPELLDLLGHLGEVGSLWQPTEAQVGMLRTTLAQLDGDDALEAVAREGVERAVSYAEVLSDEFDVVVTNPPYMGSSRFNAWMSRWVKRTYPEVKGDFCTCFIERSMGLLSPQGYGALSTSNVWMFLTSYEKLRNKLIDNFDITALVQLSVHGFKGIAAQVMAFVFRRGYTGERGAYIRLNDFDHHSLQEKKTLEAIRNPDCGWFYRADASRFHGIPGSPIAYWLNEAEFEAFGANLPLSSFVVARDGIHTCDNSRYLRMWWEVSFDKESLPTTEYDGLAAGDKKWIAYNKGGNYRKWSGNNTYVINYENDGEELRSSPKAHGYNGEYALRPSITWSSISSGRPSFRFKPSGYMFDAAGYSMFSNDEYERSYIGAFCNSSVAGGMLGLLCPTLNYQAGDVLSMPVVNPESVRYLEEIKTITDKNIGLSQYDWDSAEVSWDFGKSGLV